MTHLPIVDRTDLVRREHPLARGLVTWWLALPGLDGGPRLYDLAGPRHGTLVQQAPAPAWTCTRPRPGQLGLIPALGSGINRLAGPDAPTAAANPYRAAANGGDWTLAQWVRLDGSGVTAAVLATVHDNAASGVGLLSYHIPPSTWRVYVLASPYSVAGVLPPDGAWRHLTITRAAGVLTRHVNGAAVGSPVTDASTAAARTDGLQVGNFSPGLSNYQFQGAADDVRFYARALAAAEVRALYDDSRRGCPLLLRRLRLLPRPPAVFLPVLPVLPVRPLTMRHGPVRDLTARAPGPWDGGAALAPTRDLTMSS